MSFFPIKFVYLRCIKFLTFLLLSWATSQVSDCSVEDNLHFQNHHCQNLYVQETLKIQCMLIKSTYRLIQLLMKTNAITFTQICKSHKKASIQSMDFPIYMFLSIKSHCFKNTDLLRSSINLSNIKMYLGCETVTWPLFWSAGLSA